MSIGEAHLEDTNNWRQSADPTLAAGQQTLAEEIWVAYLMFFTDPKACSPASLPLFS